MFLFRLGPSEDKVSTLNYKHLLFNAKSTIAQPVVAFSRSLEKGRYAVILQGSNKV